MSYEIRMWAALIIASLIVLCAGVCLIFRLIKKLFLQKRALIALGDEVSIHEDMGAKMAYKGICSYYEQRYMKSIEYFERAMEYSLVSVNTALCLDWIASCYDALERGDDALKRCVKAAEVDPSNIKSLSVLADRYARRGLFEKSEYYYGKCLLESNDEQNEIRSTFMLAELDLGAGRYDEAAKRFERVIELSGGKSLPAHEELAIIYAIFGEEEKSKEYFIKAEEVGEYYKEEQKIEKTETVRLRKRLEAVKRVREMLSASAVAET